MSLSNPMLRALADLNPTDLDMVKACDTGWFWVIGSPCSGTPHYAIGSEDVGRFTLPALYSTIIKAKHDNKELEDDFIDQIVHGVRDPDDEWHGVVLACHWDGLSDTMDLYHQGVLVCTGSWKALAGLN